MDFSFRGKELLNQNKSIELFYLRTSSGKEIDLIVDRKVDRDFIEIKHSASFKGKMVDTIKEFMDEQDKGYLLYQGEAFPYIMNISIINYKNYLANRLCLS